jgi:pimeloyl-ACP methyl ester carboxylesterase
MTLKTILPKVQSEYVQAGALQMYCETQGRGRPLLLLHAGMATIQTSFERSRPVLAKRWITVAIEQQGHGHTADIDRPLT